MEGTTAGSASDAFVASSKAIFSKEQLQVLANQIRTLLNIGLRLKILSGQSRVNEVIEEPAGKALAPVAPNEPSLAIEVQPTNVQLSNPNPPKHAAPKKEQRPRGRPRKAPGRVVGGNAAKRRKQNSPDESDDLEGTSEGEDSEAAVVDLPDSDGPEGSDRDQAGPSQPHQEPGDGPPSRRSGRKTRQVSLDGVSGEALDEIVDGAPVASGASTARWTPHSTSTLPAKPAHGKRQPKRRASSIVEKLLAPDLNDRGQPKRPTLLLQLVPVPSKAEEPLDPPCSVCGETEDGEGNEMLMCDGIGCHVVTHQACYGVASIPSNDWLCDGCKAGLPPDNAHCLLCPVTGGALRKVTCFGCWRPPGTRAGTPHQDLTGWVHSACALWTSDVKLTAPDLVDGVDISQLPCEKLGVTCGLCHQPGGAVVECCLGSCPRLQHVLCAREADCLTPFAPNGTPLTFCLSHSQPRFAAGRAKAADACTEPLVQAEDDMPAAKPLTPYELEREANIQRNRRRLSELTGPH
ncbi:hypothetical protein WJX84_003690 [Apatococcus fuscideae]|uniref:Uncharacterized protein n=1 Tax=Apatococcus fuscideae TaxID=2026836 RepID=A0AAW1TAN6_9CHLO